MKKFFSVLIVFLLLCSAYLFFQRWEVNRRFADLAKGKTYSSYGLKVEIPAGPIQVRGLLRPYVDLPRVIFDLSAWGLKVPVQLEGGRMHSGLLKRASFILSFPRILSPLPNIKIDHLAFELGLEESLRGVRADSLEISPPSDPSEMLRLESPQIYLGSYPGLIPDRLSVELAKLTASEQMGTPQAEEIQINGIVLSFVSELRGTDRSWKFYFAQKGGQERSPVDKRLDLEPWEFKLEGNIKNLSREEARQSLPSFRQAWEAMGGGESRPSTDPKTWLGLLDPATKFLLRLQPEVNSVDFFWGGLKYSEGGKDKVLVQPLKGVAQMKFGEKDGLTQAKFHLDQIQAWSGLMDFSLEGVDISHNSQYLHSGYSDLLNYMAVYYRDILSADPSRPLENVKRMLLSTLSQYPDLAQFELKVVKVKWKALQRGGENKDIVLTFKISSEALESSFRNAFEQKDGKDPSNNVEQGRLDFSLALKVPWDKLLAYARQKVTHPEAVQDFAGIWSGRASGPQLHLDLDLGRNFFDVKLDSHLMLDFFKPLQNLGGISGWGDWQTHQAWDQILLNQIRQAFFAEGNFELTVKVERFSRLQAWIEKIQSGASLSLALLAPYSIIDSKADTFLIKIQMQQGQILVNSQRNETLEKILAPFKGG